MSTLAGCSPHKAKTDFLCLWCRVISTSCATFIICSVATNWQFYFVMFSQLCSDNEANSHFSFSHHKMCRCDSVSVRMWSCKSRPLDKLHRRAWTPSKHIRPHDSSSSAAGFPAVITQKLAFFMAVISSPQTRNTGLKWNVSQCLFNGDDHLHRLYIFFTVIVSRSSTSNNPEVHFSLFYVISYYCR